MTAPRQGKTELSARHHTRLSQNRLPRIEHTPSDSNTTLTPRTPKTTIDPKTTILRFWQAPRDGLKNCWVRAVVAKNAVGRERRRVVVLGATLPRVWHHRDEPVADLPQPPVSLARLVGDKIQRAIAVQPFDLCQFGHVLPQAVTHQHRREPHALPDQRRQLLVHDEIGVQEISADQE